MSKLHFTKKTPTISPKGKIRKKRKPLGQHQAAKYILIVGMIIILIPCVTLGIILISASNVTNKPAEGSRFKGDLDPEITDKMVESIEDKIKTMSGVEDAEVNLSTGQLTIYVDAENTLSNSEIKGLAEEIYETVDDTCDVDTYFTATSSKRMYDLSINVYNYIPEDGSDDEFICWNGQKNSKMESIQYTEVSAADDEELAKELRGEITTEE